MATVASGILCPWPGSVAAIPANWTRQAALDSRYPRGAAAGIDPGATGGSATHTHTDPGHSHGGGGHSHDLGTFTSAALALQVGVNNSSGTTYTANVCPGAHNHAGGTSPSASPTFAGAATWSSSSNDPTNYTVIWLQSNGSPTGFAAAMAVYWYQPTLPTGWTQIASATGAFLKGATAGVGGGTLTTAAPHTHTDATHSHTASHTHGTTNSGAAPSGQTTTLNTLYTAAGAGVGHTHPITITSTTVTASAPTPTTVATAATAAEPPATVLTLIQNSSGAVSFPAYAICLWLGTVASIPSGWSLCDGTNGTPDLRGQFAKNSTTLTDIGTTTGALGHNHTAPTATHTHDVSHSHPYGNGGESNAVPSGMASGAQLDSPSHGHGNPVSGTTPLLTDAQISQVAATTDSRPPYTDVAFVMYTAAPTLAITAPAASAVEALPSFTVTWAWDVLRTQVTYELFVYAADGVTVIYDSLPQRAAALAAVVPAGYLQNGTTYKLQVVATDSGHQTATSPMVTISTSWTAPPTPGGISVVKIGGI